MQAELCIIKEVDKKNSTKLVPHVYSVNTLKYWKCVIRFDSLIRFPGYNINLKYLFSGVSGNNWSVIILENDDVGVSVGWLVSY